MFRAPFSKPGWPEAGCKPEGGPLVLCCEAASLAQLHWGAANMGQLVEQWLGV